MTKRCEIVSKSVMDSNLCLLVGFNRLIKGNNNGDIHLYLKKVYFTVSIDIESCD